MVSNRSKSNRFVTRAAAAEETYTAQAQMPLKGDISYRKRYPF